MNFLIRLIPTVTCLAIVTPSTIKCFKYALNLGANATANDKAMKEVLEVIRKKA
jgi:hypothetical protein